jgi:[ribosomal protein S5]-alanine N-acetyltransferase
VVRETVLSTDRLVVTTWLPSDLDDLAALHSDPATMRYIGGRTESREESAFRLDRYIEEQSRLGWTKWRVATHAGQSIGRGGFGAFGQHRELGYTLRRDLWGQGLATELARALVQWHQTHSDILQGPELWAFAVAENSASRRVLEKIGFRLVEIKAHGGADHAFYTLDRSQHPRHQP